MKTFLVTIVLFLTGMHTMHGQTYPDSIQNHRLAITIASESAAYVGGISFLGFIWYRDHERVPFHFYDDSKGYLQMDKWGHAYSAYHESQLSYHALRWAGLSKNKAIWYGGTAGLLFQTPIEIFDGLYEGWGFSWSDMAANTFGSALFMVQESIWDEQYIRMKFSYSPSIYPDYHSHLGETHLEQFFLDYNAHTYWLSMNLQGLSGIQKIPPWLNVALGYSANGMIYEFRNPNWYQGEPFPHLDRYRQYLFSFDIDCSKIKTNKVWLRQVLSFVNIIKVPFPTLEWNRIEGYRFHPIYF